MSDTLQWKLPPAPGYPGYDPSRAPRTQPDYQRLDPAQVKPRPTYQRINPQQPIPESIDAGSADDPGSSSIPAGPDYSNEPYIPSRIDHPPDQWLKPDFALQGAMSTPGVYPGPLMPQARDLAPLLHSIVMGLGRWGSHYTGMPAIAMGTYASAYWKAYQAGMHERASQAYQQYRQAQQMTKDRLQEEIKAGYEALARYGDDPDKLHQALRQIGTQYNDPSLMNANDLDPAHVQALLAAKNGKWLDISKIESQQKAQEQQRELTRLRIEAEKQLIEQRKQRERLEEERRKALEKERQRYDPSATGPGPGYTPYGGTPEQSEQSEPSEPSETPEPTPETEPDSSSDDTEGAGGGANADADQPPTPEDATEPQGRVQVADASGTVPIGDVAQAGVPPKPAVPGLDPGKQETPEIERAAKDYVFNGGKLPPGLDKKYMPDIAGRIERRAGQLSNWLDKLESDPSIKQKDISPAIRNVFPRLADTIDGYLSGNLSPTGKQNDKVWQRAIALGYRINPRFSQGTFQSRQQAIRAWVAGERGQQITSIGQAFDHGEELLADLAHKPWANIPYAADIARRFGNKGVSDLDADIGVYSEEFIRAMSGKSPTIPEINDQKKRFDLSLPESYLHELVVKERILLKEKLREKQEQFSSETGFPAEDIMKRFKAFADTDPEATNRMRKAAIALDKLDKWEPENQKKETPTSKDKVINYKDYFK